MKKIQLVLIVLFVPFLGMCQNKNENKTGNKLSVKFKNKVFSKEEWESLLDNFPKRERSFLLNMNDVSELNDTISRQMLNKYFTNDTVFVGGNPQYEKFYYPLTKIKGSEIVYPIGSLPPIQNDSSFHCTSKSGKEGLYPYRVYPLGQIEWTDSLKVVLWGYPQPFDEFFIVTAYVLNQKYEKVGHFGFMYSDKWHNCDNTITEIMKNSEPLSYPKKLSNNGFLIHDKMVGNYYEETLKEEFLEVEITGKGQFEVVNMSKFYEDDIVTLWSKKGYFINDKDGYANVRAEPKINSKIKDKLPNGTALEILNGRQEWWEVKYHIDKIGYIHKNRIKEGL